MKYLCTGRVLPERVNVKFAQIKVGEGDISAVVSCDASQLTVVLDIPWDDLVTAHSMAKDVAEIVVGALGFSLGLGYSVEIIQVTRQDAAYVFGVKPESPKPGQTLQIASDHIPSFNQAFHLSASDVFFRLALRDYLRAMTDAKDCAFYCYRAIEAVKSAFEFKTRNDGWNSMHSALGTNKATIENTVKDYADPLRHGNWAKGKLTTTSERWDMLCLTRDILVQYMDHVS